MIIEEIDLIKLLKEWVSYMDKDFEDKMDDLFRSNEQKNTIKLSTPERIMVKKNNKTVESEVENDSIYNKQIGLKTSIAIMGSVLGLLGLGVYYLVVVLEVTK